MGTKSGKEREKYLIRRKGNLETAGRGQDLRGGGYINRRGEQTQVEVRPEGKIGQFE